MLLTLLSPQTAPATTSAILIGSSNNPSYRSGFYSPRRGGTPKYPSLWDGCVGAWAPSLGATGLTLRDESVYGNHGTLTNMDPATDWVVSGGKGALDFDGVDDYVQTTNVNIPTSFTVSMFVSADTTGDAIFIGQGAVNSSFELFQESGFTSFRVRDSGGAAATGPTLTIGRWTHLLGINDKSSNTCSFFVDGDFYASAVSVRASDVSTEIRLGRYDSGYYLNGQLDDIRIYNRVLTPSEIKILATRRGIAYESRRRLAVRSAAAAPSGTLAKTLDSATLSSSGTLTAGATGTLTSTLDAATIASSGTVGSGVTATVSVTLSDATLSASGTLAAGLTGSTNSTLADASLSSSGTLAAGASGTVTRTLDNATLSSTGGAAGSVSGSVSSTLAAVTCSSSATLAAGLSGTVTRTLADVTSSATGTVAAGASGSVTRTLANATLSSTGSFSAGLTASVNRALDSCVVSSTGTVANGATGSLSVQLASATLQSGNVALGGFRLKVAGEWKDAMAFVKVTGTWKSATPFVKVGGVWE